MSNTTDLDKEVEKAVRRWFGEPVLVVEEEVNHLILKARLELATGLTVGGTNGTELFYQNTPIERYIDQLNSALGGEGK